MIPPFIFEIYERLFRTWYETDWGVQMAWFL
jgi:hypothetical protein